MRKIALLTTALFGLAIAEPSFAQPNQAGPQPGLPPGAGVGAVDAVPPRATGQIPTTPAPMAAPMPMAESTPPPARVSRHRTRRSHAARHRAARHHTAAPADAPAAN